MSNFQHAAGASKFQNPISKDYLWLHLRDLPYFRALLRAVEARFYEEIDLPSPTLDLGCGDGHFASIALERQLEVGIDPWRGPLREAESRGTYQGLAQSDGAAIPFADGHFASVVSNSVLEHIPHLDEVLEETARVLKPGSPFIFCVPNHNFLPNLSVGRMLDRVGFDRLGDAYRTFFNRISRHHHCDPPEVWEDRLERAGFEIECWWHYFSHSALRTLEWGHYFGVPSWVSQVLTGKWILSSTKWNLALTRCLVQRYYDEPIATENGTYTFYIARKR
ncbi:MAG: class I SAM-dependent methyltransferase [Anaerolineales bacterium]|nr:class I SAM-dependent methyltransferase [Chloroflexota bacterium]MBL6981880.1 class I SAM-dependent methyltransferase [Anaerolineales bacterium]